MFLINKAKQWQPLESIMYNGKALITQGRISGYLNAYDKIFVSGESAGILDTVLDFNEMEFQELSDGEIVYIGNLSFKDGRLCLDIPREFLNKYIEFENAVNDWIDENMFSFIDDGGAL